MPVKYPAESSRDKAPAEAMFKVVSSSEADSAVAVTDSFISMPAMASILSPSAASEAVKEVVAPISLAAAARNSI